VGKYGTSRLVTGDGAVKIRFECSMTTARKLAPTRNMYVTLTAFLRQQWLCERVSMLRYTCIDCLVCFRHCAASREVAVSIPDGVIGIFHWLNASGRTMSLGSTQHLTGLSTGSISWEYRRPVPTAHSLA